MRVPLTLPAAAAAVPVRFSPAHFSHRRAGPPPPPAAILGARRRCSLIAVPIEVRAIAGAVVPSLFALRHAAQGIHYRS